MMTPINITHRITELRQLMKNAGADYYYVPAADPHKNEYVPQHWQRRAWISGFTGSAGDAVIGLDKAYLWTDPRYFLQADLQLDKRIFELVKMAQGEPNLDQWLLKKKKGLHFAVDPKVISIRQAQKLQAALTQIDGKLLLLQENLVDEIWQDQPPLPKNPFRVHELAFAGLSIDEKLKLLREDLKENDAHAMVVTALDAIAWTYNIRGNDVTYNPLVISYAIITQDEAFLFVDPDKVTQDIKIYAAEHHIQLKSYHFFGEALTQLTGKVWVDPDTCNYWISQQLKNAKLFLQTLPISLLKSIKNSTEQTGMRRAHVLDAIAVIRFLAWLENNWRKGITEISAATKLETLRRADPRCVDLSFNTISGFGPHGAIVHYAVTPETDIPIDDSSLYLIDSGGQYPLGTTDITRTIHLGQPTAEQKHHYTLVLKGHLAIRHLIFPHGTAGEHINAFAHAALWREALDFSHGTGHGVGSYLCVHESPPRISAGISHAPLLPGMVVSNEPGLYFTDKYGIRIENLCLIKEIFSPDQSTTGHGPFYGFDDLTLVPYCRKLINKHELNDEEITAVNNYHRLVYESLKDYLEDKCDLKWLKHETKPL